jgi:hypothetical protein
LTKVAFSRVPDDPKAWPNAIADDDRVVHSLLPPGFDISTKHRVFR